MSAVIKSSELMFHPMDETRLDKVVDIEERCYTYPWTRGIFRDCMRVGYGSWVLTLDDEIIGYCLMSMGAGEAHILNLCVDPTLQRRGYGQVMLDFLINYARDHGIKTLLLEVRPSNRGALKLYEQADFSEVGIRTSYYPANSGREDALILARDL